VSRSPRGLNGARFPPRFHRPLGPRIRPVAEPAIEGRSIVVEAIRTLAIACRARAAYPSDHPNQTQALATAQARVEQMLAAHGTVAMGVARNQLRVRAWTLDSPQAQALAQALYRRQAAVLRMDHGVQPDELRALVEWLAGPAVPLEPGAPAAGPPGLPGARHLHLQPVDYSAVRMTDHPEEKPTPEQDVSLTDRLLNVLLEWGPGEVDWGTDTRTEGRALPVEVAMVSWLTDFLRAQTARDRGDDARPDGSGAGPGAGQPSSESIPDPSRTGGTGGPGAEAGPEEARRGRSGQVPEEAESTETEEGLPSVGPAVTVTLGAATEKAPGPDTASTGAGLAGSRPPRAAVPRQLLIRLTEATTAHLQAMSGAGRALVARQAAQLIMQLPEPLRESLVRAALRVLATDTAGEDALEAFTSSMPAHPVLRVLRQLEAEGVPLSRHAQRLVELLASTQAKREEGDDPSGRDLEGLHAELLTLFREEDIDRYNPEDHLALLARAMLAWPTRTPIVLGSLETLGDRVGSLTEDAVGRQLAQTLLDLLGRHADQKTGAVLSRLNRLVEGALARGSLDEAAFAIEGMARSAADETVPAPTRTALREHLDGLARVETLSLLAAALGPTPAPAAVRLIRLLGLAAIQTLLQVLVQEQVRVRRRRVFDLLSALGSDVVPDATRWLGDSNWYVVRNMIALLRAVGDRSSLTTVRRLLGHADLRVRLEALRSLLELDPAVGHQYLRSAIADPDPRAATAAVELAGQRGGPTMVEPLLNVLAPWDLRGRRRAVRLAALQALGRMGRPEALPGLARFFRELWVPFPALAERRAAYESLQGYPPDARVPLVGRGLRSRDPEIRAVCERLRSAG
jgi:hypothetical protein